MSSSSSASEKCFDQYLRDYNDFTNYLESAGVMRFSMCPKNEILRSKIRFCADDQLYDTLFFNHIYLTIAHYRGLAYNCCMTYLNGGEHYCQSFPVMLGSDLDLQFLHTQKSICAQFPMWESFAEAASDDPNPQNASYYYDSHTKDRATCLRQLRASLLMQSSSDERYLTHHCKCKRRPSTTRLPSPLLSTTTTTESLDHYFDRKYQASEYVAIFGLIMIGGRLSRPPYLMSNNRELLHIATNKSIDRRSNIRKKSTYFSGNIAFREAANGGEYCAPPDSSDATTAVPSTTSANNVTDMGYVRYFYDNQGRGNMLKYEYMMNGDTRFIYRNHLGQEFINSFGPAPRPKLSIAAAHHLCWDPNTVLAVFPHMVGTVRDIDDFSNKLILSPSILLYRLVLKCKTQPQYLLVLYNGMWSKLVSATSENSNTFDNKFHQRRANSSIGKTVCVNKFATSTSQQQTLLKKMTMSTEQVSNIYRKMTNLQFGSRSLFSQVIRVDSSQKTNAFILPNNYTGFLCPLEKCLSINSFNKQYALTPDVIIPQYLPHEYDLSALLDKLLYTGVIYEFNVKSSTAVGGDGACGGLSQGSNNLLRDGWVLLNGGQVTKYMTRHLASVAQRFQVYRMIKLDNPFIEVLFFPHLLILNRIRGTAFKRVTIWHPPMDNSTNDEPVRWSTYMSCEEVQRFAMTFAAADNSDHYNIDYRDFSMLSVAAYDDETAMYRNLNFTKINKRMHGSSYCKNRIKFDRYKHLSGFSSETSAVFFGSAAESSYDNDNVDTKTGYFQVRNAYAMDSLTTLDGFLANYSASTFYFDNLFSIEMNFDCNSDKFISAFHSGCSTTDKPPGSMCVMFGTTPPPQGIFVGELFNGNPSPIILKNIKMITVSRGTGGGQYAHSFYLSLADMHNISLACELACFPLQYIYETTDHKTVLKLDARIVFRLNRNFVGNKFCNSESQKGLSNCNIDIAARYSEHTGSSKPQLITSAATLISRVPVAQTMENNPDCIRYMSAQFWKDVETREQSAASQKPLSQYHAKKLKSRKMFVHKNTMCSLRNVPYDYKKTNVMRIDNLSLSILYLNDCSVTIFDLLQRTEDDTAEHHRPRTTGGELALEQHHKSLDYGMLVPKRNKSLLQLFLIMKKDLKLSSINGGSHSSLLKMVGR